MKSLRRKPQATGLKFINQAQGLTIEIYDAIGPDWFGEGITAQSVSDALKGSTGPVSVRINSPGGDAFEGVAIYNLLRSSGRQINVRVDGLAASAASIIAMAGDTRVMGKGTMLMIHPAQMFAIGDADIMRKAAEVLDGLTASIADIYVEHTKQEKAQILEWVNAETWMDVAEAIDRGFATAMTEDAASQAEAYVEAITAAFDLSVFKKTPEIFNRLGVTKKVDGENLTADDFIYVGDPQNTDTWHLPWRFSTEEKTVSHLRDALSRFSQAGIPPTKKPAAYDKLVGLCKEHGIEVSSPEKPPAATAETDLYMLDIMRKRVEILRNA